MKTKLLVALITCIALGACSKSESGKEENKPATENTQGGAHEATPAQPSAPATPAPGPQGMNETTQMLASDTEQSAPANQGATTSDAAQGTTSTDTAGQTTTTDMQNKLQDVKQDSSMTNAQIQGGTAPTTAAPGTDPMGQDAHPHPED